MDFERARGWFGPVARAYWRAISISAEGDRNILCDTRSQDEPGGNFPLSFGAWAIGGSWGHVDDTGTPRRSTSHQDDTHLPEPLLL